MRSKGGKVLEIHRARWFGKYSLHYVIYNQCNSLLFLLKLTALFISMYMYKFTQRGADIVFRMTNKTMVDREILQVVAGSIMSWDSYEEEDLVRRYFGTFAKNMQFTNCDTVFLFIFMGISFLEVRQIDT